MNLKICDCDPLNGDMKGAKGKLKFLNYGNKFRMSTTLVSKSCQTIYFDKDVLHDKSLEGYKLLITVFVYNISF